MTPKPLSHLLKLGILCGLLCSLQLEVLLLLLSCLHLTYLLHLLGCRRAPYTHLWRLQLATVHSRTLNLSLNLSLVASGIVVPERHGTIMQHHSLLVCHGLNVRVRTSYVLFRETRAPDTSISALKLILLRCKMCSQSLLIQDLTRSWLRTR